MNIGERIKTRREQLGMSQDELARKLGYKNRSSINKIELNKQNLRQSKIKAIADALETTPGYIMGWDKSADSATKALGYIIDTNFMNGGSSKMAEILLDTTSSNISSNQSAAEEITADELSLITVFRNATPEVKKAIATLLGFALEEENKNNDNRRKA